MTIEEKAKKVVKSCVDSLYWNSGDTILNNLIEELQIITKAIAGFSSEYEKIKRLDPNTRYDLPPHKRGNK